MNEENQQQTSDIGSERVNEIMNGAGKKTGKAIGKKAMKIAGKGVKAVGKLVFKALSYIISAFLPWILAILAILFIFYAIYDTVFENRGKEQGYQMESVSQDNDVEKDNETGEYNATSLSGGNRLIKAFYTYFSNESYYIVMNDNYEKLYSPTEKTEVRDKYNREAMFYLSPNMLWSLDEFLNNNEFRYPEQFIKPVYYDKEKFELKELVDDDGYVVAESMAYDKNGNISQSKARTNKTTKAVYDYGFAPILHYKEYKEEKEKRGEVTKLQKWDKEKQEVVWVDAEGGERKEYKQTVAGYPKNVWMIDKVVSSAGNISNDIAHEWADSGERFTTKEKYTEKVDKVRYETKTRHKKNKDGKYLYYEEDENGKAVKNSKGEKVVTKEKTNLKVMEEYEEEVWYKEEIIMEKTIEGTVWEKVPKYTSEPDVSEITGSKYFTDYMQNYEVMVSKDVMTEFDMSKRISLNEKELEKLLAVSEETENIVSGNVSLGDFELGSGASSESFINSMKYIQLFKKYGEMYGVDPYLLVSIASQESSGIHEKYTTQNRCSIAGCGLMQIEQPGITITSATAYNFSTGQKETVTVTHSYVSNLENNIKVGAMLASTRIREDWGGNVLMGLQGYNYGKGAMEKAVEAYAKSIGSTLDEVKGNLSDTGWLAYVEDLHNNPLKYMPNSGWKQSTYGDANYIQNVLRYYCSDTDEAPWIMLENGTRVVANGNYEMGSSSGTQIGNGDLGFSSWVKSFFAELDNVWGKLFPEKADSNGICMKDCKVYKNNVKKDHAEDFVSMTFVMQERKYLSDYDDMDAMWKTLYAQLFANPLGTSWGNATSNGVDPKEYFSGSYGSPIDSVPATIVTKFGVDNSVSSTQILHNGIDIQATNGSNVRAVAEGEIIEAQGKTELNSSLGKYVKINHGGGVYTLYANLGSVKVKVGDKIKMGDIIGTAGGTADVKGTIHFALQKDEVWKDPSWIVNGNAGGGSDAPLSTGGSAKVDEIYNIMKQYLGSWYAWGGTTPPHKDSSGNWVEPKWLGYYIGAYKATAPGFDCSGLMQYAFGKAGVSIPRTAREQQKVGQAVSLDNLQPGDLIFMGANAHHVGMYIGNGQYIHSPSTGKRIEIKTFNKGSWTNARRIIG